MGRMHSPPHPGEVLREWLGDMTVTEAAERLSVSRVTLSRLLNGTSGVSADMALRLHEALNTSPEMWMGLQTAFDLWMAEKVKRPKIKPILLAA
ncbi:MAG: HigA family addiction module antitoxin [Collimonas sp.]|uniref:HigA family addiction module antitoxin n=1 Tax=Collimonas sp. TaxID=1963772 RepID=UPI003265D30F